MDKRTVTPRWAVGELEAAFPGCDVVVNVHRAYKSGGYVEPSTTHDLDVIDRDGRLKVRKAGPSLERIVKEAVRESVRHGQLRRRPEPA